MVVKAPRRPKRDLLAEATRSARNRVEIKDPIVRALAPKEKPFDGITATEFNAWLATLPPLPLYGD